MNLILKNILPFILCVFCFFSITNVFALEKNEQKKSIFWQVIDLEGKKHYLFGTIHTDDNRVSNFNSIVLDKLKEVDIFVMETDEILDRSILHIDSKIYDGYLTKQELEKIYLLADFHTMSRDNVLSMKPWLLAVIFDSPRPITPFNQDNLLKSKAEDFLKITQGLESPKEHFKVLDSFTIDEQMTLLKAVLKKDLKQKEKNYELLIKAYLSFDAEKILDVDSRVTKSFISQSIWEKIELNLLVKRNKIFGQRIMELIDGNRLFIAIGASHLGGKTGLLKQFQDAGFLLNPMEALD